MNKFLIALLTTIAISSSAFAQVKSYAKELGVSHKEAQRRLALQDSAVYKINSLEEKYASRLAGVYIEHKPIYRVVIFLIGDKPVKDFTAKIKNNSGYYKGELKLPVHFRIGAKHTRLELIDMLKTPNIGAHIPGAQGIWVDEENNCLGVSVYRPEGSPTPEIIVPPELQHIPIDISYTTYTTSMGHGYPAEMDKEHPIDKNPTTKTKP